MLFVRTLFTKSLRGKLLKYFILFALIPLIVISIVSIKISSNYITDQAITSSEQIVIQVKGELDTKFNSMKDIASLVSVDPFFQEKIRETFDTDDDYNENKLTGDSKLFSINMYMVDTIRGIYIMGENGIMYKSNYYDFLYDTKDQYSVYSDIINSDGVKWFPPVKDSYLVKATGDPVVTMGVPFHDLAMDTRKGVVIVEIKEQKLQNILKARLGKTGYIYVVDSENNIVVKPNGIDVEEMHEQLVTDINTIEKSGLHYLTKSALIVETSLDAQGWKIIGVMPNKELYTGADTVLWVIIISFIAAMILAFFLACYISKKTVDPITEISTLMNEVENGNFDVEIKTIKQDEIGKLSSSFNKMIKQIDALMEQTNLNAHKLRKAELKALQAQINPHFLYNTLGTIVWLARANDNDLIIKMVMALTRFFKIGISSGKDFITVAEEIAHVENYLSIQEIRYKEKLDYSIHLQKEVASYYTLKLILQPLVENAIYHGIKLKDGKGHLSIKAYGKDENIIFEVLDDGVGMDMGKLSLLQDGKGYVKSKSYGIKNITERIKIFFGEQYGIRFYSEPGKGTKVVITIPKINKHEMLN